MSVDGHIQSCGCAACSFELRLRQSKEEELPINLKFELDRFCSSLKRSPYAEASLKRNFAKKIRRFIRDRIFESTAGSKPV